MEARSAEAFCSACSRSGSVGSGVGAAGSEEAGMEVDSDEGTAGEEQAGIKKDLPEEAESKPESAVQESEQP